MSARRRRRSNSNSKDDPAALGFVESSPIPPTMAMSSSASLPSMQMSASSAADVGCRDRSSEFRSIVMSLRSNQVGLVSPPANSKPEVTSTFNVAAKKISHDLSNTYAKLEKLTLLAKRKSLFDDKGDEINQLTIVIKQDLGSLNKQIARLQELSKSQSSQNSRHKQTHANSVVVSLQSKLATMSGNFKSVLEVRTETLKQQKSRRDEFSQSASVAPSLPASMLNGRMGSVLLRDEANASASDSSSQQVVIDMDAAQRFTQMQLVDQQDSYIQSRAETMQNIEQTIVELGTIFQQLAHMVKEQEEMVQRIDSNVESAHLNIEAAHTELVKYFQSVTSNRWLMIKIFGVLIFFFIIFIIFMA